MGFVYDMMAEQLERVCRRRDLAKFYSRLRQAGAYVG